MSGLEKKTILLNTLFNFGAVLISLFISVYLYVYTKSIPIMCLQVICRIGVFPIFFPLAYKMSLKCRLGVTYTIGLVLFTLSLVYTLAIGERFAAHPYLVAGQAMIYGTGEGFFWYSTNTSNQIVPTRESRNLFLSKNGVYNNIAAILAPIFSTFVLALSAEETEGYRFILLAITIIFVLVSFVAFTINKRTEDTEDRLKETFLLQKTDGRIRRFYLSYIVYGLVNCLSLGLTNLLIFRAVGSGDAYSRLQILFSLITVSGFYVIRYLLAWGRLSPTFKFGAALRITAIGILVLFPTAAGAVIFGILNAASVVFFDNCISFCTGFLIDDYPRQKSALVVVREVMLSIGRVSGMLFVLLFYLLLPGDAYIVAAPILLALMAIPTERLLLSCMEK